MTIDAANFPDDEFRNYVKDNWDGDDDGTLSGAEIAAEIAAVNSADVHDKSIQSLKGIEHFTKLKILNCSINRLTSLDVSQNTKLEELGSQGNRLTFLDLQGLGLLSSVDVTVKTASKELD